MKAPLRPAPDPVPRLDEAVLDALRPFVPTGGRYALIEFPHYPNAGDSAIWAGSRAAFARLGAPLPAYVATVKTYRPDDLRALVGEGTIFLQGGGSFGDLWPELQAFREAVVREFPDRPIVQLPQTIFFRQSSNLAAARDILRAHPRYTLLVRDHRSLELAENALGLSARLVPDMAFALERLQRRAPPSKDIVWIKRTDSESALKLVSEDLPANVGQHDWPQDRHTLRWRRMKWRSRRARAAERMTPRAIAALGRSFDEVAEQRIRTAGRLLDEGRVAITDRLHGHVLCLLRRQPHVVLDNSYGKIETFREAWTRGAPGMRVATNPAEALDAAHALLLENEPAPPAA